MLTYIGRRKGRFPDREKSCATVRPLAGGARPNGRLAQLVEHLVYTERVGGSSPSPPTSISTRERCAAHLLVATRPVLQ